MSGASNLANLDFYVKSRAARKSLQTKGLRQCVFKTPVFLRVENRVDGGGEVDMLMGVVGICGGKWEDASHWNIRSKCR